MADLVSVLIPAQNAEPCPMYIAAVGIVFTGFLALPGPWALALGTAVLLASCARSAGQLPMPAPPESLPGALQRVLARVSRARATP
jgi:hypothetical protein